MFKSLKDKLKKFKSSAAKELVDKDGKGAVKSSKPSAKPAKRVPAKGGKKGIVRKRAGGKAGLDELDKDEWAEVEKKPLLEDVEGGFLAKKITDRKLEDIIWELEVALHESDVAASVIDEIKVYLEKELTGKKIKRSLDIGEVIEAALKNAISNVLVSKYINFDNSVGKLL